MMKTTVQRALDQIQSLVLAAAAAAQSAGLLPQGELAPFNIEVPADKQNGDYSTNAAMANARTFRLPPHKIAQAIVSNMQLDDTYFTDVQVAGPGFINFYLGAAFYADVLLDVHTAGNSYGRSD